MFTHQSTRSLLIAATCLYGSFANAAPFVNSRALPSAVAPQILTVQDWRAERGTTWRDQLNKGNSATPVAPPPPSLAPPNYNTNLGYGLPGYSYSGPNYDRYVNDAYKSTSTGDSAPTGPDPGVSTCPQRTDTTEPSTQTYFGLDGKRHPCP